MPELIDRLNAALAGRYRIDRELGSGGMATVYLAEDLRHHRRVAIKVLRPELAAVLGPARFLQEIEIAAGLTHPHILPLHDSGEAGGFLYYVMPFMEGESLRTKLARDGELPISMAVRILRDVVDALAAAHKQGVIHRDIKPDNVMLLDNHAVVTDFGIAKAVSEATGRQQLTTAGVALGTPAYMAPEQAVADPHVDHRADIYAVGVVAYELLTGRPPFTGLSPQEVLAAHVTEAPEPVTKRRQAVPPPLAELVMRCLAKKPADRWQSAAELLHHLEALATPSGGTMPTVAPVERARPRNRRAWSIAAAATVLGIGGALWLTRGAPGAVAFGRSQQVTAESGLEIHPAISPDGRLVAYAAGNAARMRIFIRPVGGGRTLPLSDDSTAVESQPRWSPDGNQLLFLARGGVSIAPALGGTGRPVVAPSATTSVSSAAWSPDGSGILFVRGDSLHVAAAQGGASRLVAVAEGLHSCRWSPDGRGIACVVGNGQYVTPGRTFGNLAPSAIIIVPPAGGTPSPLTDQNALHQSPEWSPDGRRLYFISNRDGPRDVYAQEITSRGGPRGAPSRVTTGLNAQSLSVSADGSRFAYNVYTARANIWLVPIPSGAPVTTDAATPVTSGNQVIESMRVSGDGRWLVYDSDLRGNADIYRIPMTGGQAEQLTSEPFDEFAPDLSPDGRAVAYHSWRTGTRDIEVKPLDGSPVQRVTDSPRQESYPSWSPDGRRLVLYDQAPPATVMVGSRTENGRWSPPDTLAHGGGRPSWSPDGRAIAYTGTATATLGSNISVVLPDSRIQRVVYQPAAAEPQPESSQWAADGRTIYFKSHDAQGRASIWTVAEGSRPRLLVRFPDLNRPSNRVDFASDGRRFYFTLEDRESDIFVAEVVGR